MRKSLRKDTTGTTQLVALIVATGVFMATFTTLVIVSYDTADTSTGAEQAGADSHAARLAAVLVESNGIGWYAAGSACMGLWEDNASMQADLVQRLGLASEACTEGGTRVPGNLSFEKLANLRGGAIAVDPTNGRVDYEEARLALGLADTGFDFHIRTTPLMASASQLLSGGGKDPYLRPIYIGDYEPDTPPASSLDVTAGLVDQPGDLTLWVAIRNNGITATAFEVVWQLGLDDEVELVRHTPILAPGELVNVTVSVPKGDGWEEDLDDVEYRVSDPFQVLASGELDGDGVSMAGSGSSIIYDVSPGKLAYELTSLSVDPKIHYAAYTPEGEAVTESGWRLEVYDALGVLVASDTSLHARGWEAFTLLLPGVYDVYLKSATGVVLAEDRIVVVASALAGWAVGGEAGWSPEASVLIEAAFIDIIAAAFDAHAFHVDYGHPDLAYQEGGDVYPDAKTVMDNDVPAMLIDDKGTPTPTDDEATLANYNLMVVGSNVDHNAMTSAAAKNAIRDWVYAGGTLVVLGSHDQAVQWLQPIFHASLTSASGGLSTVDATHSILNAPNRLDYAGYTTHDLAWTFGTPDDEEHFTHVVVQGDDAALTVSNAGQFGDGNVILSSWRAFDLLKGPEGPACTLPDVTEACDGFLLLHNLLTQGTAAPILLDYGPPLPTDRSVGSSVRVASVWHPGLDAAVPIRVQVFVF